MPSRPDHQPSKHRLSREAEDRVSRQMQALDDRIERSPCEENREPPHSVGLSRLALRLGNSFRVNFVTADRGRNFVDEFLIFVRFVLGVALLLGGVAIAIYVIWRLFIPVMSDRLNIPIALSAAVFVASIIRVEAYENNGNPRWRWGLQHLNLPLVRLNAQAYLGINLVGGAIPVAIALYQLTRVPIAPTLFITGLVATAGYFSARVVPKFGIFLVNRQLQLIALVAALTSMLIIDSAQPIGVAAAFTGCVMGSLIGVDLLHLKDMRLGAATRSPSIGGGGLSDGILILGLMAALTAEYLPQCIAWLERRFALTVHVPFVAAVVGTSAVLLILRGCYKTHLWTLSKGTSPSNPLLYLGAIAASYAQKGRAQKAEKLYKKAIALCNPLKAEDRHYKINYLIELAFLYTRQDRLTEAELAYQQSLSLATQYAANHPNEILTILFNFAQLYERQQHHAEARRLYTEALVWIDRFIRASIVVNHSDALTQAIKARLTAMTLAT